MKKERYFRNELQRMFINYGIIPTVVFTLICGLVFMAVLLYGRGRTNEEHNQHIVQELERVLSGYDQVITRIADSPQFFLSPMNPNQKMEIFEPFYQSRDELGYRGELFLLDASRRPLFSEENLLLNGILNDAKGEWGIFGMMNRLPQERGMWFHQPWDSQNRRLVMGKAVVYESKILGYVLLAFPSGNFQMLLDHSEVQTIVTNKFNWVFLSNHQQFLTSSGQLVPELVQADGFLGWKDHISLVVKKSAYENQFTVYTVSNIQTIITSLSLGSALILMALTLMTVWMLFNAKRVTEKKTEDFYKILETMEEAAGGNLEHTIIIKRDNEFATIADTYNQMIASLKTQMENNQKMTQLVASSQNKQLKSQFHPHFLYNTLENIRYMCKLEPDVAEKMVYSLSGLLRYSLDGTETEVTLGEDLKHLENYLTILQYRFSKRFSFQIQVDPETLDCRIPKLVLQPMIENSVKYGFGNQESLQVELKAYQYEGKLIMICRDDGVGIPSSILGELTQLLGQEENTSRHSGIYNIHRRILLLYGAPYGVEIRSSEGYGTTLVVTLPATKGDEIC